MLDKKAILDGLKNNTPHKLIQRWWLYHSYFKKKYEVVNLKTPHEFEVYTIAFNNDRVIDYQIKFMQRNFKDNHIHIIVDNSSDEEISKSIRKVCKKRNTMYIRLPKNPLYTSQSHALALNYTCKNIIKKRGCKYFGFLDHDIFPIKITEIKKYLDKQGMYGYLLDKQKLEYARNAWTIWPGFCFFKTGISKKFDFRPKKSLFPLYALDTGGGNYNLIFKRYDKNKLIFAKKELIGVREDLSEFKMDYTAVANYSKSIKYWIENKMYYNYENLMEGERIHRGATYRSNGSKLTYEQYRLKLEEFYKKLDSFYNNR